MTCGYWQARIPRRPNGRSGSFAFTEQYENAKAFIRNAVSDMLPKRETPELDVDLAVNRAMGEVCIGLHSRIDRLLTLSGDFAKRLDEVETELASFRAAQAEEKEILADAVRRIDEQRPVERVVMVREAPKPSWWTRMSRWIKGAVS